MLVCGAAGALSIAASGRARTGRDREREGAVRVREGQLAGGQQVSRPRKVGLRPAPSWERLAARQVWVETESGTDGVVGVFYLYIPLLQRVVTYVPLKS